MEFTTQREIYVYATESLKRSKQQLFELKQKQRELQEHINIYEHWINEAYNAVCRACDGRGYIRPEDDIKTEVCSICKGTGLRGVSGS